MKRLMLLAVLVTAGTAVAAVGGFAKTFSMTLKGAGDGSTLNGFPLAVRVAEGLVPGGSATRTRLRRGATSAFRLRTARNLRRNATRGTRPANPSSGYACRRLRPA